MFGDQTNTNKKEPGNEIIPENEKRKIHRYLKNKTRKDTRMKFYKTVAVPTFLYASETWTLGKNEVQRIQSVSYTHLDVYKRQGQDPPRIVEKRLIILILY